MPIRYADKASGLTAERLREILDYDPETGVFRHKLSYGRVYAGTVAGCRRARDYWGVMISKRVYLAHRLAWLYVHGAWPADEIDHINGVATDNRISNLREATSQQNKLNTAIKRRNKAGVKGAAWIAANGKWMSEIRIDGRRKFLGYFASPVEASNAYHAAAKEIHGEFYRQRPE